MITKGTNEYKKAQQMANLFADACMDKAHYDRFGMYVEMAVEDVKKLNTFAAEVAKTIDAAITKYGMPRMSAKQAWILACACVENGYDY